MKSSAIQINTNYFNSNSKGQRYVLSIKNKIVTYYIEFAMNSKTVGTAASCKLTSFATWAENEGELDKTLIKDTKKSYLLQVENEIQCYNNNRWILRNEGAGLSDMAMLNFDNLKKDMDLYNSTYNKKQQKYLEKNKEQRYEIKGFSLGDKPYIISLKLPDNFPQKNEKFMEGIGYMLDDLIFQ